MRVILVVSPHLDDAVLSCGGMLATVVEEGGRGVVVTVFAGTGPGGSLGWLAALHHRCWGLPESAEAATATRRREDLAACAVLGARAVHLDHPEALYRSSAAGVARCRSFEDLFSAPGAADGDLVDHVGADLRAAVLHHGPDAVYCPAAVGGHLDHQLTRQACRRAVAGLPPADRPQLYLYEDLPYAAATDDPPFPPDADTRAGAPADVLCLGRMSERALARKLTAVGAYTSQLDALAAEQESLAEILTRHANDVGGGGPAERYWRCE